MQYISPHETTEGAAMKILQTMLVALVLVLLTLGVSGCASKMIGVHDGAERVSIADANQVANCQLKSKNTVTVLAKIGFITRSADDVEANLTQLAINDAVDAGADTVVKGESTTFGTRTFTLYKCRP
jgi:hypothetical protein